MSLYDDYNSNANKALSVVMLMHMMDLVPDFAQELVGEIVQRDKEISAEIKKIGEAA
jgi:hypothetical protein